MSLLFATKTAAPAYAMSGRLYKSTSGFIMLSVPNAIVRGVFDTIDEPGVELPPSGDSGQLNAHISVMRPEEIDGDKVTERGHSYHYTLGPLKELTPGGWAEMSKAWIIQVKSPELEKLRKSYGLTKLPHDGDYPFHITVAVRRKNVLNPGDVAKMATIVESVLPAPWVFAHIECY